jgi:hypothetical protein
MHRAAWISPQLVIATVALTVWLSACGGQTTTTTVSAPPPGPTAVESPPTRAADPPTASTTTETAPPAGHLTARQSCVDAANRIPDAGGRDRLLAYCKAIDTAHASQAQWHLDGFASPRQACTASASKLPDAASRRAFLAVCNRLPS